MEDREREARLLKSYYEAAKRGQGITQKDIGDAIGVHQSRVAGWLNGHHRTPDHYMEKLGEMLGFDPDLVRPGYKDRGITVDEEAAKLQLVELIMRMDGEKREQVINFARFLLATRK